MSKGSRNRTNVYSPEWSKSYDRIFSGNSMSKTTHVAEAVEKLLNLPHPIGSCGGLCDKCEGDCDDS